MNQENPFLWLIKEYHVHSWNCDLSQFSDVKFTDPDDDKCFRLFCGYIKKTNMLMHNTISSDAFIDVTKRKLLEIKASHLAPYISYFLADIVLEDGNGNKAIEILLPWANHPELASFIKYNLGKCYIDLPMGNAKAISWFTDSAMNHNNTEAMYQLGLMYSSQTRLYNDDLAFTWFKAAADLHHQGATHILNTDKVFLFYREKQLAKQTAIKCEWYRQCILGSFKHHRHPFYQRYIDFLIGNLFN